MLQISPDLACVSDRCYTAHDIIIRTYVLTYDDCSLAPTPGMAADHRRDLDHGAGADASKPGCDAARIALAPADDAHPAGPAGPAAEPARAGADQRQRAPGRSVRHERGRRS